MKAFALYGMISLAFVLFVFGSGRADSYDSQDTGRKVLFTKHFKESLFDVTEHAAYSVEVLLDETEHKIGKNVIGIVVHDNWDADVAGAQITIVQKEIATGGTADGKLNITDKKNGLYIVSGLDLKKEGRWELLITVRKAGVEDRVKFLFPDALNDRPAKGRYSP